MSQWIAEIRRRLAAAQLDPAREAEIAHELEQHLEDRYREMRAAGHDLDAARRAALAELDDDSRMRRELASVTRREIPPAPVGGPGEAGWFAGLWPDTRYAFRSLCRQPGFTLIIVMTLALGIGANTALFSIADAVLLRPLPYGDVTRLVQIESAPFRFTKTGMSASRHLERSPVFAGVGIYAPGGLNLGEGGEPERVNAAAVSAGFFEAMGAAPAQGRTFTSAEEDANARVVVIGHELWRRRFAAAEISGQTAFLNGQSYVVLGVMPPRFDFPDHAEAWVLPGVDRQVTGAAFAPDTVARLAPGVTIRQAKDEVERIKYNGAEPDPRDNEVAVTLLREQLVGSVRPLFVLIAAAAVLVLLVACMNTANLLLARVSARERELSIRRALGASRARLVRFLLCESAVLSTLAGVCAIPVARATVGALGAVLPPTLNGIPYVAIDTRAVAVAAGLSVLCLLVFGLAPALSVHGRAGTVLRGGSATPGRGWRMVRGALVALQIAAGLVLLSGAAAIAGTVASLMRIDLGFRGEQVVTFQLTAPMSRYDTREKVAAVYSRIEERLRAVGGVTDVGVTTMMPGSREVGVGLRTAIQGLTAPQQDTILFARASEDYFSAMGIDLRAGRSFTSTDRVGTPAVAVVTEAVARTFGLTPAELLGRRIRAGFDDNTYAEIVGVVADHLMRGPEGRPGQHLYVPFAQSPGFGTMYVAVRAARDPSAVIPDLRAAIGGVDPELPPYNIRTGDEIRAGFLAERRFARAVMVGFAILTAALSAIGLYGVVSYLVQLRSREFGIRVALGATSTQVVRSALGSGLTYALTGICTGGVATVLLSGVFISRVPGLVPVAPVTLLLTATTMIVLSVTTAWLPARRAARLDPTRALRME